MRQQLLGDNHPHVATSLNNLAHLYYSQVRYSEAEPLYLETINIFRERLWENHPHTQIYMENFDILTVRLRTVIPHHATFLGWSLNGVDADSEKRLIA